MKRFVAVVMGLAFSAIAASQEPYPSKSVRLLVGAAPGGNPDVLARLVAPKLSEAFGRAFVVENVPGAGGAVVAEQVARAPADGHTLMLGDSGALAIAVALNPRITYHPLKDFTPITAIAALPTILVAHPSLPVSSLQDYIKEAKAKQLAFGSPGLGSVHHLTMAVFLSRAGVGGMLHVPYKGGSPMVAAVLTGEVQSGWSGIPNVAAHIRAGKLKALCISTLQRSGAVPDVPPCAEQGFPGFDIATVMGLQAPAGLSRDIAARLQAAFARAMREKDVAERMASLGMIMMENGTEHYQRFMREDLERYQAAVKQAGIKSE
jgi:tripartite-type tricarboxylate transporter receptor subunit TctC